MAEQSFLWTTGGAGDGAATYSRTDWQKMAKVLSSVDGDQGIGYNLLNALQPTVTGLNTVQINTGGALVDGKPYYNDGTVNINVPSAVGAGNTRIDYIVLRASWTAQTVRLARVAGTDAATPSAPSLTQNSGTTFELPVCRALVNTSGTVTITDEREMTHLVTARRGGHPSNWEVGGSTIYPVGNAIIQVGAHELVEDFNGSVDIYFPEEFASIPIVLLSLTTVAISAEIQQVYTDHVNLYMTGSGGFGNYTVFWMAVGPSK